MKKILHLINLLSLDVVAGAVVCHLVFCKLMGVQNLATTIVLGCSTFIIYVVDRFLDNQRGQQITTERHQFHAKYKQILQIFIAILFVINIYFVFELPKEIIEFGIFLGMLTAIYLWIVFQFPNYHHYHKEFFVTLIYSLGVVGTAFVLKKETILFNDYILGFNFFLVAGQALLLFSWFEVLEDSAIKNMATWLGTKTVRYYIFIAFVWVFITAFFMHHFALKIVLTEALMAGVFVTMSSFYRYFLASKLYRPIGEAVFILPIILL